MLDERRGKDDNDFSDPVGWVTRAKKVFFLTFQERLG